MNCSEIAAKIEDACPEAGALEVARICTLLSSIVDDTGKLQDDELFMELWQSANMRLCAAEDQHAAVTAELELLAHSDPLKFCTEKIWILVRAINIQSQILRLYVGDPELDCRNLS